MDAPVVCVKADVVKNSSQASVIKQIVEWKELNLTELQMEIASVEGKKKKIKYVKY